MLILETLIVQRMPSVVWKVCAWNQNWGFENGYTAEILGAGKISYLLMHPTIDRGIGTCVCPRGLDRLRVACALLRCKKLRTAQLRKTTNETRSSVDARS